MNPVELQSRLELAKRIALEAGRSTMGFFRRADLAVETKSDGSPLTHADRNAELLLREAIQDDFPDDSIIGEEFGRTEGRNDWVWILDPIDGTKSFIAGVPLFGTMVGIAIETSFGGGEKQIFAQAGVIYFPALQEGMFAGRGIGAWHFLGVDSPTRASVSDQSQLGKSILLTSAVEAFSTRQSDAPYRELARQVYFARTWGDAYGYMLVATGRAEIMIDPILSVWDAAAVQPIIEEAGGQFTDWQSRPRITTGSALATNGKLHAEVLKFLAAQV